jgi:PAS domain S-box-containing protein
MRNSVSSKVVLGVSIIVLGATLAMFATFFLSTVANRSTQDMQEQAHTLWNAANGMDVSGRSAEMQLVRYLEAGDPKFREEYLRHSEQFRQHANRFQSIALRKELKDAGKIIEGYQKELDHISRDLMAAHDQQQAEFQSAYQQLQLMHMLLNPATLPTPAIGRVSAGLANISLGLQDIFRGGRNDAMIATQLNEIRSLITSQFKPPTATARDAINLQGTFESFITLVNRLLQSAGATRTTLAKAQELQRQITGIIDVQIKPALARQSYDTKDRITDQVVNGLFATSIMTLLVSLLALLVRHYVQRAIFAPIEELAAGADMVAAGNLSHRVVITAADDYAELVKKFNHMVDQLQGTTVSKTLHEEQETQLRNLLDGVHDYAIFSVDDQGFVTKWNAASTRILGYEAEDMEGVSFARIFKDVEHARITRDEGLLAIASAGRFEADSSLIRKDGGTFDANVVVTPLSRSDASVKGYSVVVRDITERVKAERHIEQLATKDALTGLSNRSMLMEQMQSAIARGARAQTQVVVMFIDLDHFKAVNDSLGHAAGDQLLREPADRMRARSGYRGAPRRRRIRGIADRYYRHRHRPADCRSHARNAHHAVPASRP